MKLNFATLRAANTARLPQFKNRHGGTAHSRPDGSDWSPAQWLQALVGEVGEFAAVRLAYELGQISRPDYIEAARNELADIQTYLDLLAARALDGTTTHIGSTAHALMALVAALGDAANTLKKFERGDFHEGERDAIVRPQMSAVITRAAQIMNDYVPPAAFNDSVHQTGVDLGMATLDKFNVVSQRVGSTVFLGAVDGEAVIVERG